jgi:hypothetical protein
VARDRVSHLGVNYNDPLWHESSDGTVWAVWLTGTTEAGPEGLVPLARSWLQPAELKIEGADFAGEGYDRAQRAYIVRRAGGAASASGLRARFLATADSPLVKACLIVKNWGDAPARVSVGTGPSADGRARIGYLRSLEGTDLIVWLDVEASSDLPVVISPVS